MRGCRHGDINAIVDQHSSRSWIGAHHDSGNQVVKHGGVETPLADLNQFDPGINRFVQQRFERNDFVADRARFGIDPAPVSDEAQARSRPGGHDAGGESEAALRARITFDKSRRPVNAVTRPMPVTPPRTNGLLIHSPISTNECAK